MASNVPALVTVNGVELPEPSSYDANTSTIVDSGRNVQGKVVGNVIRHDVAKISLGWNYISAEDWAKTLSLFTKSFYCSVRFLNQTTNKYETRQMYISDRSAGMWRRSPSSGSVMGWIGAKLSLVEV